MERRISERTLEEVGILAKLELTEEEKAQAGLDMSRMLDYVDKLKELDTEGVEPLIHIHPIVNVFREDTVTNGDGCREALRSAPRTKDGMLSVPRTIE